MDLLACLKEVLPPDVDAEAVAEKMRAKGYAISEGEADEGEEDEPTGEVSLNGAPGESEPKPEGDDAIMMHRPGAGDGFIRNAVRSAIEERKGKRKPPEE